MGERRARTPSLETHGSIAMRASRFLFVPSGLALVALAYACSTEDPAPSPVAGGSDASPDSATLDSALPIANGAGAREAGGDGGATDAADAADAAPTPDLVIGYTGSGATKGSAAGNG